MTEDHQQAGVGSVGEEATKLLGALQDWARDNGSEYAASAATAAAGAASRVHQVREHVATGGDDCRYCPVCQVISAVRGTSPEVREHLAAAATSLMHAAAGLLDTPVPSRDRRDAPVERIDLDRTGDRADDSPMDGTDHGDDWEDD